MFTSAKKRRKIRYSNFEEMLEDAQRLTAADAETVGNWTKGQIFEHLARAIDFTLDGFDDFRVPWFTRTVASLFLKKWFMTRGLPAGFRLKNQDAQKLVPDAIETSAALHHLQQAVHRLRQTSHRCPHPVFGSLTQAESDQLQLRHTELHMSFIAEPTAS